MERRDPIPPGIYWLDVPKDSLDDWSAWVRKFSGGYYDMGDEGRKFIEGRVKVLKSDGAWKLFQVLNPVPRWSRFTAGFPTIAKRGKKTSKADSGPNRAASKNALQEFWGEGSGAKAGVVAFVILYFLSQQGD